MSEYRHQLETIEIHRALPLTVSRDSNHLGMERHEPIIIILDSALRYAKAYEKRYDGQKLADEAHICRYFISIILGARNMLNWDGAVALEMNRSSDSKDNGACEALFWHCVRAAGLKEEDLNL